MKHPAQRWIAGASLALLLAVLGSVALLRLVGSSQVRRLPDGSQVRLERVAVERSTRRYQGPEWQRPLWELSGRHLQLAGNALQITRRQNVLTLELSGDGIRRPQRFDNAVLLDEHDCIYSGWQEFFSNIPGRVSAGRAELAFPAYPRHQSRARAGFLAGSTPVLFDVPLSSPGPASTWSAKPYPQRHRHGELTFTLTRLSGARLAERLHPRAYFEVERQGRPTSDWVPGSIRVSDGTGNSDQLSELALEADGGVIIPGLCTREPAWKLETWFTPRDPARVTPDLEWSARDVEIAGSGKVATASQSFSRSGITLEVLGTAGAGDAEWTPGTTTSSNTPVIRVRATLPAGAPGAVLSLVRVTDASGATRLPTPRSDRLPSLVSTRQEYLRSVVEHNFPLRLGRAPGKLDFTFRLHRLRKVDFLASPPR